MAFGAATPGQTFSPASRDEAQDPKFKKKRLPIQQALQSVSLQLPKTLGPGAVSPSALMSGRGLATLSEGDIRAMTNAYVNSMTGGGGGGGQPPAATSAPSPGPSPAPSPGPSPTVSSGGLSHPISVVNQALGSAGMGPLPVPNVQTVAPPVSIPNPVFTLGQSPGVKFTGPTLNPNMVGGGYVDQGIPRANMGSGGDYTRANTGYRY